MISDMFKKYFVVGIIVILFTSYTKGHYFTNSSKNGESGHIFFEESTSHRFPKLLTFNTEEDGDVGVELEFRVPFLSIPVKRTMESVNSMGWGAFLGSEKASANLNVGAVVLSGIIVGAAVVLPAISSFFLHKKTIFNPGAHEKKTDDNMWQMTEIIDRMLAENNIDKTSCIQRVMCRITKSANTKLKNGNAASHDLIISGLVKNSYFNNLIQNTYVHGAINSGLDNANCLSKYKDCKVNQKTIHRLVNKVSSIISNNII